MRLTDTGNDGIIRLKLDLSRVKSAMAETDHLIPFTSSTDYTARWEVMAATLREQAAQFDFSLEDRRDASYWEIVNPLFAEMEHIVSEAHSGISFR